MNTKQLIALLAAMATFAMTPVADACTGITLKAKDGAVVFGRTMEWDTAAGDAVLRGAGGHVVRFDDHSPLAYGKPGWDNPFFIAHAPGVVLK